MTIAVYPGSFDPVHNGHIDIATRASGLFDRLIVAIYDRPIKNIWFSPDERTEMMRQALAHLDNVSVTHYNGLTVDFVRSQGAQVVVRGLRMASDFDLEYQMALTNKALTQDIETVCLFTDLNYAFISSSMIKEVAAAGGDISKLVPGHVRQALAIQVTRRSS
ncbi:MAG: pantetheine-phosphate adenylyltransferase [Anaerolineae bacterium]|nr:pantetheine-phosphate adenylyltransferase [Anaerolineae bacterium]